MMPAIPGIVDDTADLGSGGGHSFIGEVRVLLRRACLGMSEKFADYMK
jgi:hypothetical protein